MASTTLADTGAKLMNYAHRAILTVSGNRLLAKPFGMPLVELHTVGRKSGLARSNLLTAPVHDDSRLILVASKGGDDRDPDWYRNLMAAPDAEVTVDGKRRTIHARTATDAERAELWPRIVAAYRGYANYQERTERSIPVVVCDYL